MATADSNVSLFTSAMRTEFIKAFEAVAEPAPWEKVVQIVPSSARIEHYHWMSPAPGVAQFKGHRKYGKISTVRYSVENLEFSNGFEVSLRDVEDDQVGGYTMQPKQLAERCKNWPGRWSLQHMAAGASRPCFDGTNFFADSHTLGSGDNSITATGTANSDGLTYKIVACFTGGPLKPFLWQNRKSPKLMTNAGTPQSEENKVIRYWTDLEGEAAYSYWWNSVLVTITNLPSVTDMHGIFRDIENSFRSFILPKSAPSDESEKVHEGTVFSAKNLCLVGSTKLAQPLRQALNESWVPQSFTSPGNIGVATTNTWQGFADYFVTQYLD